ncbi:MAG: hypothetical protein OP8BY_0262 [Candidatus Saccharicenans subterraneus]|uniref:Uncharacterized protein n=1 Tax=Candidatus Saccharicenans subterraneus TaxID=2508984 RepID=A0A3E2BLP4_9BACT|nr:MAG: hypothetical protein OP8BY_0262 [Candidatus Saccharicenans subterraneum]
MQDFIIGIMLFLYSHLISSLMNSSFEIPRRTRLQKKFKIENIIAGQVIRYDAARVPIIRQDITGNIF